MTQIEMVEKLRERADVNYADAKDALERSNWDLLDAMILLEREGKVKVSETAVTCVSAPGGGDYSTKAPGGKHHSEKRSERRERDGAKFTEFFGRLLRWLGMVIGKGNVNMFVVERNGESIIPIPVTVLVLLLIIGFWVVVPLIIVGLFFGLRYSFSGPDLGRDNINGVMHKASDAADRVKEEFQKGVSEETKDI